MTNCSSLLQSGKLVTKMFQKIQQLIDDKDALVFVLIDEVKIPTLYVVHYLVVLCVVLCDKTWSSFLLDR